MIDHATAERIKAVADIVDVVGDYVKLTRRGANYMGLCPFHNERTPSFSVNKARNFCYCFSCHTGGSPVNFIMKKEGIGYQDALRQLARKYGIKIEERELTDEEKRLQSERESLFMAGEWAMQAMERNLTTTADGRSIGLSYLYQRGITDEAIRKFHLGYSPDRNVLEEAAKRDGYDPEALKKIGLLGTNQQGQIYDRFKGRVMYPVLNPAGKVVAFGGRDLKGGPAKYINSPESEIYKKSNELYGLYQARQAIVKADKCFLVEGYMDVIGMWQSGMENVIASSGTALTDAQIALLHRFTSNVTLLYDGDSAGVKASLRGIDMLLAHNMDIKVLLLPDGHDPDSFARANTPEQFRDYVAEHEEDFITFKARILLNGGLRDPQSKTKAATSIVESLACIGDKVKRSIYIKECSRILDIDEQALSYEADAKRHQVVNKIKEERQKKTETENLSTPEKPSAGITPGNPGNYKSDGQFASPLQKEELELRRIERQILKYCVRYGMITFIAPEDDEHPPLTLVEYIDDEMRADNIIWQEEVCSAMFEELKNMVYDFRSKLEAFKFQLDEEIKAKFKAETAKLLDREMDLPGLEKAEKNLHESLDEEMEVKLYQFSRDYASEKLVNHERDDFRSLSTEMISEPHILSKYHSKTGNLELEEEKIYDLAPRALNELRAQIVEIKISHLEEALKSTEDYDIQLQLLSEMKPLQKLRQQFAMTNGERIINPRS